MATALQLPKFQTFDVNGDPLSGGLLYVYEAGTTTPATSYTTSSLSVANTNPVVLDSNGRADIWFGSGNFKIVLRDSDDVLQYTVDDINVTTAVSGGDLTQANYQAGTLVYAASSTGTDAYAISLPLGTKTTFNTGFMVRFAADVANTGAATLSVTNSDNAIALGSPTITAMDGSTLNDADIAAGAIVQVIYDGTNFQLQTVAQGFTQEQVEDIVGDMVTGNSEDGIAVTYDDGNGKLDFATSTKTFSLTGDATASGTLGLKAGDNASFVVTVVDDLHNHTTTAPGVTDGHSHTTATLPATLEETTNKAAANGYASLDADTKLPFAQLPTSRNCRVYRNAALSPSDNTLTTIIFDFEQYDTDAIHDLVTNPDRLTVPSGVTKVRVTGGLSFYQGDIHRWEYELVHSVDGVVARAGGNDGASVTTFNTAASLDSGVYEVVAGEYFYFRMISQDINIGGAAITVVTGASTFASMEIIE